MEKYFSSDTSARKVRPRPQGLKPSSLNPTAVIDASSENEWAYFDFSSGGVVRIDDPSSLEWDVAFRRNKIISNGGKTNPQGQVAVVNLGNRDINDIKIAPEGGYTADTLVWGENTNKAIGKWYNYDTRSSILASKGDVYIFRTIDNGYAKMRILSYYCQGRSACYTIEYSYDEEGVFDN
ncbi:MAG: HmuY family protein [Thermodesulfobacteriota bacterium]